MTTNLKTHDIKQRHKARRQAQQLQFTRNQAIGLLLTAAAVLAWRLSHTPSGWLFPPGWWRLW